LSAIEVFLDIPDLLAHAALLVRLDRIIASQHPVGLRTVSSSLSLSVPPSLSLALPLHLLLHISVFVYIATLTTSSAILSRLD
jgi:hypothetical protein